MTGQKVNNLSAEISRYQPISTIFSRYQPISTFPFPLVLVLFNCVLFSGTYVMLACAYHKGNETNAGWEFFATHLARSGLFEENDDNQFDIGN